MKRALEAAGVQTARFFLVHGEEELEAALDRLTFPVIIKAVDLMGSRGIFRCDTREEARENFQKVWKLPAKTTVWQKSLLPERPLGWRL